VLVFGVVWPAIVSGLERPSAASGQGSFAWPPRAPSREGIQQALRSGLAAAVPVDCVARGDDQWATEALGRAGGTRAN